MLKIGSKPVFMRVWAELGKNETRIYIILVWGNDKIENEEMR